MLRLMLFVAIVENYGALDDFLFEDADDEVASVSGTSLRAAALPWVKKMCSEDIDCSLSKPFCFRGTCHEMPYYVTSDGECACKVGGSWARSELCGMNTLRTTVNSSIQSCFRDCDVEASCEGIQAYYDDHNLLNCTLLEMDTVGLDGKGIMTGSHTKQRFSTYCFAKQLPDAECRRHVGCMLSQRKFCCPTIDGYRMGCCEYSPRVVVIISIFASISLILICTLLCNIRHCCARAKLDEKKENDMRVPCPPPADPEDLAKSFLGGTAFREDLDALRDRLREKKKMKEKIDIIAFVNPGSGDQGGESVISHFGKLCTVDNKEHGQAFNITKKEGREKGIERVKEKIEDGYDVRILAVGGDGTVTWLLSLFEWSPVSDWARFSREKLEKLAVGIIPAGTGNDLARSLGWGPGLLHPGEYLTFVRRAVEAHPVWMDQWKLTLGAKPNLPAAFQSVGEEPKYEVVFNNYFSIGMDAQTTYEVHEVRKTDCGKRCFRCRCVWPLRRLHGGILCYVAHTPNPFRCCCCKTRKLNDDVKIKIGENRTPYQIPSAVRQITLTNLNSYGAGMHVFSQQLASERVRPGDGKLELFTLHGPYSTMGMVLGKKISRCCCNIDLKQQVESIEFELNRGSYFQVDGEPWVLDDKSSVKIEHYRRVQMLCPRDMGYGAGIWTGSQKREFWTRSEQEQQSQAQSSPNPDTNRSHETIETSSVSERNLEQRTTQGEAVELSGSGS